MNIQSSNKFYNKLMESSMFNTEQKIFIKKLFGECRNEVLNKIRLSCKCSAYCGRPTKIKNKQSFYEMISFYKKGYISMATIQKIYQISKQTFFRYAKEVKIKDPSLTDISQDKLKQIEELFNQHAWGYAEIWTNKLYATRYREDMKQDCLTKLWVGTLDYFINVITIPYKTFCNNICEGVLREYIDRLIKEKKVLRYDDYYSEDEKINYLDKYIVEE